MTQAAQVLAALDTVRDPELDELRALFLRKAVLAGADLVCRPLLSAGRSVADLADLTLGDVPPSEELTRLRARRAELGLPSGDESPLLVDAVTGEPIARDDLTLHLGKARLTRVGVEANTGICRGLLHERYGASPSRDTLVHHGKEAR